MARTVSTKRLEAYRQQQIELAKKIREAEAQSREAAKADGKRKCELAGALALKEFEANPQGVFATALLGLLNNGLTKPADRALFALPPLPRATPDKAPEPAPQPVAKTIATLDALDELPGDVR